MTTKIIGSKDKFAIEYVYGSNPNMGYVKLWLNNIYIGADEETYFSYIQGALRHILTNKENLKSFPFAFESPNIIIDQVVKHINEPLVRKFIVKSFGGSFDDFLIICFFSGPELYFVWQLLENPFFRYPEYPRAAQISSLDINYFEDVICEFEKNTDNTK
jgi:hypothetical protein